MNTYTSIQKSWKILRLWLHLLWTCILSKLNPHISSVLIRSESNLNSKLPWYSFYLGNLSISAFYNFRYWQPYPEECAWSPPSALTQCPLSDQSGYCSPSWSRWMGISCREILGSSPWNTGISCRTSGSSPGKWSGVGIRDWTPRQTSAGKTPAAQWPLWRVHWVVRPTVTPETPHLRNSSSFYL